MPMHRGDFPLVQRVWEGAGGTHSIQRACALSSPACLPAHGNMCVCKMYSVLLAQA